MSMKHFLVLKTKHCIYRTPRGLLCSRLAVLYHWLVFWRLLNSLSSPVPFLKPSPFQKNRNNVSCFKGGQWEWSGSWKNSRKKRQPGIKIFKFNKHRGSYHPHPALPAKSANSQEAQCQSRPREEDARRHGRLRNLPMPLIWFRGKESACKKIYMNSLAWPKDAKE